VFALPAISGRLINRGQRKESDIDVVDDCENGGWSVFGD
jgi:hypothetical protein